jgi:hypothetical protein
MPPIRAALPSVKAGTGRLAVATPSVAFDDVSNSVELVDIAGVGDVEIALGDDFVSVVGCEGTGVGIVLPDVDVDGSVVDTLADVDVATILAVVDEVKDCDDIGIVTEEHIVIRCSQLQMLPR